MENEKIIKNILWLYQKDEGIIAKARLEEDHTSYIKQNWFVLDISFDVYWLPTQDYSQMEYSLYNKDSDRISSIIIDTKYKTINICYYDWFERLKEVIDAPLVLFFKNKYTNYKISYDEDNSCYF